MTSQRQIRALRRGILLSVAWMLLPNVLLLAQNAPYSRAVESLGDESYRERKKAQQLLSSAGPAAEHELIQGLDHRDLEVRWQCRQLLNQIREQDRYRELHRFMLEFNEDQRYDLPGWEPFRACCGIDIPARSLFRRLLLSQPAFMHWLQQIDEDSSYDIEQQLEDQTRFLSPDTGRLRTGDSISWSMLLLAASHPKISQFPVLGSHIRSGLEHPQTVQGLVQDKHNPATIRLLTHWLEQQSRWHASRSTLRLAMLYQCEPLGNRIAHRILSNRHSPPASVQTALLYVTRNATSESRSQLKRYLNDSRTCQIWQIVGASNRAIQTQVRDTALAALLHLEGLDPRLAGYRFIQADPLTVYREQSLGFDGREQREQAHRAGFRMLETSDPELPDATRNRRQSG